MARHDLEIQLAAITALARQPLTPEHERQWRAWLTDPSNLIIARAAEAIGEAGWITLTPVLAEAFLRLVRHPKPVIADKVCRAKEAIVTALDVLGNLDDEPYLYGLRHVQMEPVFAHRLEDTAGVLRGRCAVALARTPCAETHFAVAPLLVDPEPQPRLAAVSALVYRGGAESELLLRARVLAGGADAELLDALFVGLLTLNPERSLPFVTDYLRGSDREMAEQAALALGNAHLPESFPTLRAAWEANSDLERRKSLLLAMALTRTDEAFDYVLNRMRDGDGTTVLLACDALALYGVDRRCRERMEAIVAASRNPRLIDAYTAHFPPAP